MKKHLFTLACTSSLFVQSSQAALLANYFNGDYSTDSLSGSELANNANVTASDMSRVIFGGAAGGSGGTMRDSFGAASFTDSDASTGSFFLVYNGQNADTTLSDSAYIQFSVTAGAGNEISLNSLQLDWAWASDAALAGGWTSMLDLTVSTDGGTIFNTVAGSTTTKTTGAVSAGDMNYFSGGDDLQISLASLGQAESFTFRIRTADSSGSASNATNLFQNIMLDGDVVAVPEPSSTALLGLGGLAFILRRRK